MTPERWKKIEVLFEAASALSGDARSDLLDRGCAGDGDLRDEIERMLAVDLARTNAVRDAVSAGQALAQEHAASGGGPIGRRFGPYRVTAVLGYGGMGAVYRAMRDDQVYTNDVAIKALRHDFVEGPHASDRFRQERQILAGLTHPNIARLLDGGEEPTPYLVMENIEGVPITRYCVGLPVEARLRLFLGVCEAVQYAHAHLVVHRDLKPANILVTADGVPKLLDFGIAKLLPNEGADEFTRVTQTGVRLFTPDYASPEQFCGFAISTASDIYSLGAILYELLADCPPHRLSGMTPGKMEETITAVQPTRPSAVAPEHRRQRLMGDLDNIVLMALRKEPERRYPSAEALAEDIRRHLDGRPVLARPSTVRYRTAKFLRRHAWGVMAACVILMSLVISLAAALYQARLARDRYRDVRQLASRFLFEFDDSIKNLPGTTRSRELVVQTGLMYLDRLYRDSGGDLDVLAELAAAYAKIGDVQGNPAMASLGRTSDALASYARSCEFWEKVVAARPSDYKALRALAQARFVTGDILRVIGKPLESGRMFASGASAATAALRGSPNDPDFIFVAAGAFLRAGDYHTAVNEMPAAREDFQRSLELYQRAQKLAPQDRYLNAVAIALSRLGLSASAADRLADARSYHDQSLAIRQDLSRRNPDIKGYQRGFAAESLLAGAIFSSSQSLNLNDPEKAIGYFRRGLAIQEALSQADPNDGTNRVDLTIVNMRLCETLSLIRPREALGYCAKAIEIGTSSLAGMWRDDVNQYLALANLGESQARLARGEYASARASAEAALHRMSRTGSLFIGIPYNRMRSYTSIGDSYAGEGDVAQALEAYRKGQAAAPTVEELDLMKLRQLAWISERMALLPGQDRCANFREAAEYWQRWRQHGGGAPPSAPVPGVCR